MQSDRSIQKAMITTLQTKVEQHEVKVKQHEVKILALEQRVKRLSQASEGYIAIRRRFIEVFKRDVNGSKDFKNSTAIQNGNIVAHEGDALTDAMIYENDQRTDARVYRQLYGLHHTQVLAFRTYPNGLFISYTRC